MPTLLMALTLLATPSAVPALPSLPTPSLSGSAGWDSERLGVAAVAVGAAAAMGMMGAVTVGASLMTAGLITVAAAAFAQPVALLVAGGAAVLVAGALVLVGACGLALTGIGLDLARWISGSAAAEPGHPTSSGNLPVPSWENALTRYPLAVGGLTALLGLGLSGGYALLSVAAVAAVAVMVASVVTLLVVAAVVALVAAGKGGGGGGGSKVDVSLPDPDVVVPLDVGHHHHHTAPLVSVTPGASQTQPPAEGVPPQTPPPAGKEDRASTAVPGFALPVVVGGRLVSRGWRAMREGLE